jgi:hypothetical protein
VVGVATVILALGIVAGALAFSNTTPISVADGSCDAATSPCVPSPRGTASPYPSNIVVSGVPTNPPDVTVTLERLIMGTSQSLDDLDIALVGPNGNKVVLMSDAGQACDTGCESPGQSFVFNDSGSSVPQSGTVGSGPWKPTDYAQAGGFFGFCTPETDTWPSPFPVAGSFFTTLMAAYGSSPGNGTWSLYIVDDCRQTNNATANSFAGGWSLTFGPPTGVNVKSLRAVAARGKVTVGWRTASEAHVLGFNVYRSAGAAKVKINRTLVRAKLSGRPAGASYRLVDSNVRPGVAYTYRLQVVAVDGARLWGGSTTLRAR